MSVSNQYGFNGFPVPIGAIFPYAGTIIPDGYLVCDGAPFDGSPNSPYHQLAQILGVAETPNLNNAYIGGNNARQNTIGSIQNLAATLTIDAGSVPSFSASVTASSFTGLLNQPAQTKSNQASYVFEDEPAPDVVASGAHTTNSVTLTLDNFEATYSGGGVPANAVLNNIAFNPAYIELQHIIKAV